jgi:hypothetical protein
MKRLSIAWVLAFVLGLVVSKAHAADNDSLTVTITPNAFYAVDIDTASVVLDLGSMALSASTQTVQPATVTIQSTYAQTDLTLIGNITAPGGTPWTFDASSASVNPNELAAWATFTTVSRSSAPIQESGYFSGTAPNVDDSDLISGTARYVGTNGSIDNLFEAGAADFAFKDMDALAPDPDPLAKSHLWLYFRMPSASSSSVAQNISVTLTAVQPQP